MTQQEMREWAQKEGLEQTYNPLNLSVGDTVEWTYGKAPLHYRGEVLGFRGGSVYIMSDVHYVHHKIHLLPNLKKIG